ncbi:MAG: hypothetical protein M3Q50_08235 [Chloroflexota bacterium]|nr:hypothetical protein [Chloroflexota bacterium]
MDHDDWSLNISSEPSPRKNFEPLPAVDRAAHLSGDRHAGRVQSGFDIRFLGNKDIIACGDRTFDAAMDVE